MKLAEAFFSGITLPRGRITSGSSAVTGNGMASLIHHTAIHSARPHTRHAGALIPSGGATKNVIRKSPEPTTKPICRTAKGVCSAPAFRTTDLATVAGSCLRTQDVAFSLTVAPLIAER